MSLYITTSETQKPPPAIYYCSGHDWERGLDPWHKDAFKGLDNDIQVKIVDSGKRKGGWYLLDYYGHQIAFVEDGSKFSRTKYD